MDQDQGASWSHSETLTHGPSPDPESRPAGAAAVPSEPGFSSRRPGFKSLLHSLVTLWSSANYLTSPSPSTLCVKWGWRCPPPRVVWRLTRDDVGQAHSTGPGTESGWGEDVKCCPSFHLSSKLPKTWRTCLIRSGIAEEFIPKEILNEVLPTR